MKKKVAKKIANALKKDKIEVSIEMIENAIEIPPSSDLGDFAFPCFILAKDLRMKPQDIAILIRKNMGNVKGFEDVQTNGPYINFYIDKKQIAFDLVKDVLTEKENYGKGKSKERIMIEFPSPNTNKPLHLGHLRNMAVGESVSRILEFGGDDVIRANLNNDRGVHICKSMYAYQKWGKNKEPDKKSDHFVGDYYVLFAKKSKDKPELEEEAIKMLQEWEAGEKEVVALWKKMNNWAFDGFDETYKKFGIEIDKNYFESDIYKSGKELINEGLKKGVFEKRKDGAIAINLEKEKLGEKVVLRSDGTSVYITQDLFLAKLKFDEFKVDKSIYVTGNEQDYHFNVLKTILEKLGFNFNIEHLSYGMVNLPEGKMKSREGTVVDADDLIEKVQDLMKAELKERYKLTKGELESRSLKIALASIKYLLLRTDIKKDMLFNPKESISFEGDTGPYIQYSYARASSILRKYKDKGFDMVVESLHPKEIELIKKLFQFKEVTSKAYETMNPSLIAHYVYSLAQTFNEFYHACPVIGGDQEVFRVSLVRVFKQLLKNSLYLLGIDVLEEM